MKHLISAKPNTAFNLPVIAMAMAICEDLSEQLHLEITGKSSITNFMHKWSHTVVSNMTRVLPFN
jgi:hypothetical protein